MDTYEKDNWDNFYTALEVAEILGLDKNTILSRCKKNYYTGAIKTDSMPGNPHGMWLIPKSEIDNPLMIKDVATLTRQITPAELEKSIGQAIAYAVTTAVEPLQQKIDKLTQQLERSEMNAVNNAISTHKKLDELMTESRAERQAAKKSLWKFW